MADISEQDFRLAADEAIEQAERALLALPGSDDFEVERQGGVLQIVFEEPTATKFVVSPNAPVRQIWVSALSRSFKLSWTGGATFALDGEPLQALLARLVAEFLNR